MYIPEFYAGIATAVIAEVLILMIAAAIMAYRRRK